MLTRLHACLRLLFSRAFILYTPDKHRPSEGSDVHPYRVKWQGVTNEDNENLKEWCSLNPK